LLGGMANSKRAAQALRQATAFIMREVDEIANIQRGLLPSPLPAIPGVEVAAIHQTFDRAGGDYYDVFPVYPPGHETGGEYNGPWAFLIADASGHGASAAVVIAMLSTLVHSRLRGVERPGELLEFVNKHLVTKPINGSFVTAFLLFYYPSARFARYASAGHNPPYIRHRDGTVRPLDAVGGVPLGIDRHARYADSELHLEVEDRILLYTDGITEARAPSGQLFGEERLEDAIRVSEPPAESLIELVLAAVRQHQSGQRPSDDQTMLALRITESATLST
jgi:sigma-B regulation protein RsbU (phosphoserine phosphatase)